MDMWGRISMPYCIIGNFDYSEVVLEWLPLTQASLESPSEYKDQSVCLIPSD